MTSLAYTVIQRVSSAFKRSPVSKLLSLYDRIYYEIESFCAVSNCKFAKIGRSMHLKYSIIVLGVLLNRLF